ncbi:uncharacterized protein KY384_005221 [Bacidia gigantensis]|uniref:uncharacterized protein n=1 Tax=Bacidia gigantensis TaxID=2732470 RepID=UPI001D038EAD|nr:uncharacterized protein KY384_005221 [Bacidia gigantensis]KAG8529740.1 hypothetical protein KY384_005221 [Bacidia gigantensis]
MDEKDFEDAVNKFEEHTSFYPSDILDECPKFRILVVGQTGSGKSTLCSKVFGVGKGQGKVGGPVDSAEETFFKKFDLGNIPVVAVFTHFDKVEEEHEMALIRGYRRQHGPRTVLPEDLTTRAHAYAVRDYDEIYRANLEKILGPHSGVNIQRVSMPDESPYVAGDDVPVAEGVKELVGTTLEMLTSYGLRRLWISAQQQSADLKRSESVTAAMAHFNKVTITNSVPLIPFLGGTVFRTSFNDIYSAVSTQYSLIDPYHALQKPVARKRIFGACLRLSTAGTTGVKFAMSFNVLGPMTAPSITKALLKMIIGVIMIHEELFWKQRDQGGLRINEDVIKETCRRFADGERRHKAAGHIDGTIDISKYRDERYCTSAVITALRM